MHNWPDLLDRILHHNYCLLDSMVFTTCNENHARFMDKYFYAYLSYYKKDIGCHLQLSGKAIVVNDYAQSPFSFMEDYSNNVYASVLVKLKIMQAELFENKIYTEISLREKIKSVFANLFLSPTHKVSNFS